MLVNYNEAEKIWLIDFSNLTYISYFGWLSNHKSPHIYGVLYKLLQLVDKSPNVKTAFVFAFDGKPKRKLEIYPEYKANRPPMEFNPLPDIKKMVKYFNCSVIYNSTEEADDTLASFTIS